MRDLNPSLPDQIQRFLEQLSRLRVYGEYLRALNLKWDAPDGRTVNRGIIQRDGLVWTNEAGMNSTEDFGRRYNEALASAWGGTADPSPWGHIRNGRCGSAAKLPASRRSQVAWMLGLRSFAASCHSLRLRRRSLSKRSPTTLPRLRGGGRACPIECGVVAAPLPLILAVSTRRFAARYLLPPPSVDNELPAIPSGRTPLTRDLVRWYLPRNTSQPAGYL